MVDTSIFILPQRGQLMLANINHFLRVSRPLPGALESFRSRQERRIRAGSVFNPRRGPCRKNSKKQKWTWSGRTPLSSPEDQMRWEINGTPGHSQRGLFFCRLFFAGVFFFCPAESQGRDGGTSSVPGPGRWAFGFYWLLHVRAEGFRNIQSVVVDRLHLSSGTIVGCRADGTFINNIYPPCC